MEDTYIKPAGKKVHLGNNIARIRELKGMKQETLAEKLGTNQQAVSRLEQKETMDTKKLEEVAEALGVTSEAIKSFNEDAAITIINNQTYNDSSSNASSNGYWNQPTFNPLEKIMELSSKVEELYNALLKSEQEKVKVLAEANKTILRLAEEVKKLKEKKA